MKNTSVALGSYFDDFIKAQIAQGRYNNASEVIRAGLRLLEDNESRVLALKKAIQEGLDSGIAADFDPVTHLRTLKTAAHNGKNSLRQQGGRGLDLYLDYTYRTWSERQADEYYNMLVSSCRKIVSSTFRLAK